VLVAQPNLVAEGAASAPALAAAGVVTRSVAALMPAEVVGCSPPPAAARVAVRLGVKAPAGAAGCSGASALRRLVRVVLGSGVPRHVVGAARSVGPVRVPVCAGSVAGQLAAVLAQLDSLVVRVRGRRAVCWGGDLVAPASRAAAETPALTSAPARRDPPA
jgi:hypothetical protein